MKTRLAKTAGDETTLKIYLELMIHTRDITLDVAAKRFLYYSHFIDTEDDWHPEHFHKHLQEGRDLGEKMKHAFQTVCQNHKKVVIIGSDCPLLTPEIIGQAFEELEDHPFVIGPAMDGGYYLLGMNNYYPEVFNNTEWGSAKVLAQTIEKIENLGQSYYLLKELPDVDFEEDWKRHGWDI